MGSMIIMAIVFFIFLLPLKLCPVIAQTNWIRAAYYNNGRYGFPIANISSTLFTHLICTFAFVKDTSYELLVSPADEQHFSTFTNTVKLKNPSVTTLLSIGSSAVDYSTFSSMVSNSSYRKSFINSSIKVARSYGFQGLEFAWNDPNTTSDMFNMGLLFQEWRAAISLEATNSNQSHLVLTARVLYSPSMYSASYPVEMIQQHLNWVHVLPCDSSNPPSENLTAAHAPLYSPPGNIVNMDHGIREWIHKGLSPHKLVMILTFYGYAWMLQNPTVTGFGAPATKYALNIEGSGTATYKEIKNYIKEYGPEVPVRYNSTYVVNYWTKDIIWIEFDDIEAIRAKISYAKKKRLRGYSVWHVSYDYNWVLSKTAAGVAINDSSIQEEHISGQNNKSPLLVILLSTTAAASLLTVMFMMLYCWKKNHKIKYRTESDDEANKAAYVADFSSNVPNLMEYTLCDLEAATNGFSIENKLGQGGYGTVYKGILSDGQQIAIKKLSKTFTQGIEEFKNEVKLTAKLQHVNLIRIMGFCVDEEEQILVYKYVQNKSLDLYLFDPIRRLVLDWKKRVHIIEGVILGLLYLQEYSRLTIISPYLTVNNVLLDGEMKPKISDFGMPRIFVKDNLEASTNRLVNHCSTKSDVYNFGILLLQIISGKRISISYGLNENLSLPHYAYELWIDGKGMEFMDDSLDDSYLSCKLMRCLQIALLCVQKNRVDRPTMVEVLTMLKNESKDIMIPRKPTFLKQNEQDESRAQLEDYSGCAPSINDVTISDLVPR